MNKSSTNSSSLYSSRPSQLNLGSLVELSPSIKEKETRQNLGRYTATASSVRGSQTQTDTSSYQPIVPIPAGRPLSSAATRTAHQLRSEDRQISSQPSKQNGKGDKKGPTQRVKQRNSRSEEKHMDATPLKSPYVRYVQSRSYETSDAAQTASKRRIERRNTVAEKSKSVNPRIQEREEVSQLKLGRPKLRIFAGSLDPEHIRPTGAGLEQTLNISRTAVGGQSNDNAHAGTQRVKRTASPLHRVQRQPRGSRGKIDPEYVHSTEVEVSEAVKNSRRRRADRETMPFNDRYRHEERRKAWTSKASSNRID